MMEMLDPFLQSSNLLSMYGAVVVFLLVFLVSSSGLTNHKCGKEPPGPRSLPLIGNMLQLDLKRPWKTYVELSKKYGSVFTVYLGPKKVVVLAGYKTVKEALVNRADEFGDRDQILIMSEFNGGHGIIWSNGDSWREMRRFALSNLKDFGMGRRACEDKIIEECHHLTVELKRFRGEVFDTTLLTSCAISNIICSMVYGSRYSYSDPMFTNLVASTRRRTELLFSPSVQLYNLFPWLFKWVMNRKEFHRLSAESKKQNLDMCNHLKKTLDPQECRGFVDAFLAHRQNLEKSGIPNNHFHDENLLYTIMNLFAAGSDTTAVTLRWGLLFMAKYPKIQAQVQEELSRVIGNRQVQVEDRKILHFTNAVIHETQRMANIAPISLPHKTHKDVTFQGHFIKKGTTVYPLLASVLFDESEWERPHTFYPAHFLNEEGEFVKRDAFLPFSAGRRACPGESLSRMELFIFISTLLQHFSFTVPAGVSVDELSLSSSSGNSHTPLSHELCAVPRLYGEGAEI